MMFLSRSKCLHLGGIGLVALMMTGPATAQVSVGSRDGGLGVGIGIGGVSVGATLGGRSVADVDASVGRAARASATVGGTSVADVSARVGSTVGAKATVGGTGSVANASVGIGSTSVGACVGGCTTASPTSPTSPTTPATPVAAMPTLAKGVIPVAPRRLPCASPDGNTTAFNGYPLIDRHGNQVGIIHSMQLAENARIAAVSIQTSGKSCASLSKVGFTVAGYQIRGAFDGARAGLLN